MTIDRPHASTTAGERDMLTGFLDHYRATLALKCDGLSPEQLAERAVPPSTLSLLGLLRHMAEVERVWFCRLSGDPINPRYYSSDNPDGEFDDVQPTAEQAAEAWAYWREETERSRAVAAAHELDDTFVDQRRNVDISLRWLLVHMIEEYARHCGHADLLRERIDGTTGS